MKRMNIYQGWGSSGSAQESKRQSGQGMTVATVVRMEEIQSVSKQGYN